LDNETSNDLEHFFKHEAKIEFQYVPTTSHRRNKAERAMRTIKNHLTSMMATADPLFPEYLWDEMLLQAEITVNMLRPSANDMKKSAYMGLYGTHYDFLAHPMAPVGTAILIYDTPSQRATFDDHGVSGFYIGPEKTKYRSYRTYVTKFRSFRSTDTVAWFPTKYKLPGSSPGETLLVALKTLESTYAKATNNDPTIDPVIQGLRESITLYNGPISISPTIIDGPQPQNIIPTSHHQIIQDTQNMPKGTNGTDQGVVNADPLFYDPPIRVPVGNRTRAANKTYLPIHSVHEQGVDVANTTSTTNQVDDHQDDQSGNYQRCYSAAIHPTTGKPLKFRELSKTTEADLWEQGHHDEFVRLIETSKTMQAIKPADKPVGRIATYYNPQPEIKFRDGNKIHRIRGTIGGDRAEPYPYDKAAYVADMVDVKLLLNSVVSTPGSQFMTMDITDFYLGTPLIRKAYMKVHRSQMPVQSIEYFKYTDASWWYNDYIIFEISKGIYGLPEAGKLAQDQLYVHLATYGYRLIPESTGLFVHDTRPTKFTLVVDDFGVQYSSIEDLNHLSEALKRKYTITIDMAGSKYLGLTIEHDKIESTISISMPEYISKVLTRFEIPKDGKPQHAPAKYECSYGKDAQLTHQESEIFLSEDRKQRIQQIVGCCSFYARAVDSTMLVATNRLGSQQAHPTDTTDNGADQLLQYAATYPVVKTVFRASDMILRISSDSSYLTEQGGRSRVGGYHDLIKRTDDPITAPVNGALIAISVILSMVVASIGEAEYGGVFINDQIGVDIRQKLIGMGYPQPPTVIITDNQCAAGLANKAIKQLKTKSIDMRFHCIRDRIVQHQFKVI
jgi:hypothetical protein